MKESAEKELHYGFTNNKQLSAYICKVREIADRSSCENKEIIDAVYSVLILCFNNCEERIDVSRRHYYTSHCFIPEVTTNKQAINHLVEALRKADRINIEYWLRSAEVMIGDNNESIPTEIMDEIINQLHKIAKPTVEDRLAIAEYFKGFKGGFKEKKSFWSNFSFFISRN